MEFAFVVLLSESVVPRQRLKESLNLELRCAHSVHGIPLDAGENGMTLYEHFDFGDLSIRVGPVPSSPSG